jgi:2EXR family
MASILEQTCVLGNTPAEPAASTTAKFELFPKLPAEIRLKIWKMALLPKRHVVTSSYNTFDRVFPPLLGKSYLSLRWVNFESREIWKENYSMFFGANEENEGGIWVNPEIDTLCFDGGLADVAEMNTLFPSYMERVQFIGARMPRWWTENCMVLDVHFPSLVLHLKFLKAITLHWTYGVRVCPSESTFALVDPTKVFKSCHENYLTIRTLDNLGRSFADKKATDATYEAPRLICVFPPTEFDVEEIYFESS